MDIASSTKHSQKTRNGNSIDNQDHIDDKLKVERKNDEILQFETGPHSGISQTQDEGEDTRQYSVNCSDWLILKTMNRNDFKFEESPAGSPQWEFTDETTICLQEIDIKVEILDEEDQISDINNREPNTYNLQTHARMKKINSKTNPSHQCNFCPKVFIYKSSLTVHERLHTGEHLFLCERCPKKFAKRTLLQLHIRSHTGEKPYSCQFCTVKFSSRSNQQVHLRIHTGEKPHSCEICLMKFNRKTQLTEHIRIHTRDLPFLCTTCPKKFSSKVNLTVHQRVHTGEKPYSCGQCPKDFGQRTNLFTHMLIHTEERPFSCDQCSSKFKRKQHLTRHLLTHNK
ncbi:Gastrula zinc finger protein XlCGF17.1-like [Oopsacas minuta]|uniref:Gastrula zinc finger protein XlCGF17.1-like n=1 Tax=Oopsacas minuta TaxID=111878 RepID=A0AAV7K0Q5_9METZ|nr:Gastrula zinc finger protein XlCGF17.1-like [Oopsacas minuta]